MKNKLSYALKKCKPMLIIVAILWVVLSIVLIAPVTVCMKDSTAESGNTFLDLLLTNATDIFGNLGKALSKEYIKTYLTGEMYLFIVLMFFGIVGFVKTLPKNDYRDIEHGSSDWANGEQYAVLHRSKGILLAEKHYLPVDKRGNVNVLVVGRFWFW